MEKEKTHKCAETCRKIRLAYLYEVNEFAKLIGIKNHSVYMYEKGVRQPKLATIRKYIEFAKQKEIKLGLDDFLN